MNTIKFITATFIMMTMMAVNMTGCVSSKSGKVYSRDNARKVHTIEMGTVESVREVTIEGTKTPLGSAAGAVAGGILGSTVGSGSGKTVATVAGALAGAAAGTAIEEGITKKSGLEIIVRKDDGQTIVVVQEDDTVIAAGDRVKIIRSSDGVVRVSK